MPMTRHSLRDLGEFGLIQRIRGRRRLRGREIIVGIGDDAAVVKPRPGMLSLLTVDTLVEGVHFDLRLATPEQIGWKALAVNLSDIAAMAGIPRAFLVSLGVSRRTPLLTVDGIYSGLLRAGRRFGVPLAGGDTVASPIISISVTVWGEVERGRATLRSGARVGDSIYVTGDLGASSAGLLWLRGKRGLPVNPSSRAVVRKHLLPVPRLKEARLLTESLRVHGLIDISDGLASDLSHICTESGVGARIHESLIPVSPATARVAQAFGKDPLDLALDGGEDYELLFTVAPREAGKAVDLFSRSARVSVTRIGKIIRAKAGILRVNEQGEMFPLPARGYDHFRS